MKKIFKGIAVLAATAALGTGLALTTTGCSSGKNGTYNGEFHYLGAHGSTYGIVVEVTVENNIITKVKNLTNTDNAYAKQVQNGENWTFVSNVMEAYGWTQSARDNWVSHENWLLQQYEGWSVADVLDLHVYTDYAYKKVGEGDDAKYVQDYGTLGEPCKVDFNKDLEESGLLISGATQGSGRVLLAVQNALKK